MAECPHIEQHSFGSEACSNRGLFADYFLERRLPELPEWQNPDGLEEAFKALRRCYQHCAAHFTRRTNETQTEHDFIQPVLDLLWRERKPGDCCQVPVRIPNVDTDRQPDYGFFRTASDRVAAASKVGTMDFWRDVPCLADAKKWNASLDCAPETEENSAAQICNHLYRSRVRWGILTNGRIWRLYERGKSRAGGIYFEVDLEAILRQSNPEPFKFFYLFFRREAFLPDAAGNTFLDGVFQGSVDYAMEVGDRLQDSVYDALCLLMNGFFEIPANGLDRKDAATVALVHENSMILLFRLLFLLYAEDRDLLSWKSEPSASHSLCRLRQEINQHLRDGKAYLAAGRRFWGEVTSLWEWIDGGVGEGGIPSYNGGLFSPTRYPHLAHTVQPEQKRWDIGDRYLAEVIDRLAYDRERWDEPGASDVDYATLEVQHLGSIYEGLLELQPRVASEALVEQLNDGNPVFTPVRRVPNPRPVHGQTPRTVAQDEVYLVTDRGERRATGSYYTPKYVVDYIVENTVGALAEGVSRQVAKLRPNVDKQISNFRRKRRQLEKKGNLGHAAPVAAEIDELDRQIDEQKQRLLEPYLSLRVLDPAMGSGHFLLGAADFLSMAMATDPNLLTPQAAGDDAQARYRRQVVERCLYGVDLNPLAVELAKLSLWLHTVSKNRALSSLDHHLRCGNSLIGAGIQEHLMHEPPRLSASGRWVNRDTTDPRLTFTEIFERAHVQSFLDTFRRIGELTGIDVGAQRVKDDWYRAMDADRERFRAVANCWLAPFFGVPIRAEQYEAVVDALSKPDADWNKLWQRPWFRDAQSVAHDARKRFFHWELEFPEAFLDAQGFRSKEERGFDAVIGNPPYINANQLNKTLSAYEKPYWKKTLSSASGAYDLYVLFLEQANRLTRNGGLWSLITPSKFLSAPYAIAFREVFPRSAKLLRLLNLTRVRVFEDPSVYPVVTVNERAIPEPAYAITVETPVDGKSPSDTVVLMQDSNDLSKLPENIWGFLISDYLPLLLKVGAVSEPLRLYAEVRASSTAAEADSFEDALTGRESGECKKFINTGLIDRYATRWGIDSLTHKGRRLAMPYLDLSHPVVSEERRLQYNKPKLVFAKLAKRVEAFLDGDGEYASANTNFVYDSKYDLGYLAAILNSRLMSSIYEGYFGGLIMSGGYFQFQAPQLRVLPIRRVEFTTSATERKKQVKRARARYARCLAGSEHGPLLEFVDQQLALVPARVDVVHDTIALLSQEMVTASRARQEAVVGFVKWLERRIGAEIDGLANKKKLRAYDEYGIETLLRLLRANRRRLTVNIDARDIQESIEREYNRSMGRLEPLRARIAATDRLIEQVVYRLYGLTREEIAMVERG